MLMQYEFYPLKDNMQYPFENNGYSEIVYDMVNTDLFHIVKDGAVITKTVDQILNAGYLDQYNKEAIREIFKDHPDIYFVYNTEQEKYCVEFLFTDEEKAKLSERFQSILQHLVCVVFIDSFYISLNNINKKDDMTGDDYIGSFWIYSLMFTKEVLEQF
jgi:hydroxymethylpyrimidine pyrophosphatase-like HAD family hydrolase